MVDITKLDMSKLWAASGDKIQPADEQLASGWLVQQIPRQTWNWFENRQDQNIAYLLQKGIPEWDSTTEYRAVKSYVQRNGVVYKCAITNTGEDPAVASENWIKAFPESSDALEALRVLVPASDVLPYFTGTTSAGLTTLSPFARTLLDDADASSARTTLSAQLAHINLSTLSTVTAGVNSLPYFTGTNTAATTLFTAFARTLLDDADASSARTTLGLGNSATLNVGTGAGQVAAGNDTRITEALQKSSNLSELANPATARTNLGLGTSAIFNTTTSSSDGTINRLLKTGDFGLGGTAVVIAESALSANNIYTGFYFVSAESLGVLPINAGGYVLHIDSTTTGQQQQFYTPYNSPRNFSRSQVGGVWTGWYEEWNSGNTSADVRTILSSANYAAIRSLLGLSNTATAGTNSNITSLTGLTTPLSVSQGGTGVTTSTGTGSNVLSISPVFTGTPSSPTPALNDNTTKIATTAYVQANSITRPNFIGTVSESGGVATGAIIETGTNANGTYIKFADGTQICRYISTTRFVTTAANGAIFLTPTGQSLVFPAVFISAPSVTPCPTFDVSTGTSRAWLSNNPPTTESVVMVGHGAVSTSSCYPGYIAIGRWF